MDISTAVITIVGANIVMLLSSLGIAISLHIHMDKKIDAMAQEMKDFHGRLCEIKEG